MSPQTPPSENPEPIEPESTNPPPPDASNDDSRRAANDEAARRRLQLREVEAERDALASRLQAASRAAVEAAIQERGDGLYSLKNAADLWSMTDVDAADLINEQGQVDRASVQERLKELYESGRDYLFHDPTPLASSLRQQVPSPKDHPGIGGEGFGKALAAAHRKAMTPGG